MTTTTQVQLRDLSKFMPEARRVIALARVLGWSVRWTNQRHRVVALRVEGKEILVPSTNINSNRARSWTDQIIRHTPLQSLKNLVSGDLDLLKDPDAAGVVAVLGTELMSSVARRIEAMDAEDAAEKATERTGDMAAQVMEATTDTVSDAPTLVSTRPWMARKGGADGREGVMYESPVVVVEAYSDGTEVFRCRNCRYSNENPRSVASHNARAHPAGEPRPAPVLLRVNEYEASGLHREQSAARRLAADITAALDAVPDWGNLDASELALSLAERIIEARPERAPAEPLTDEQIVRRITALVDHGRLADMHLEVQKMTQALADSEAQRAAARAEAETYAGNLKALREMLDDTAP